MNCVAKVQVLLKYLNVYSEQLAVAPAATTQGSKLFGISQLGSRKGKFVISCALSFRGDSAGWYCKIRIPAMIPALVWFFPCVIHIPLC